METARDRVFDPKVKYAGRPAAFRVFRYPSDNQVDEVIAHSLGRPAVAYMPRLKSLLIHARERFRFDEVPGHPDMVAISHAASSTRFDSEQGSLAEQELVPFNTAKQFISTVHPMSMNWCRQIVRSEFESTQGSGAGLRENLAPRWSDFRKRFLADATQSKGKFNVFEHKTVLLFRRNQIAAQDKIPVSERATEVTTGWGLGSELHINVGGLKGARLLCEGGFYGPHEEAMPEKLRDVVFLTRGANILFPVYDNRPLMPPASLTGHRKLEASTLFHQDYSKTWFARHLVSVQVLAPVQSSLVSSFAPPDDSDGKEPCFFCNKSDGSSSYEQPGSIVSEDFIRNPLAVVQEEVTLLTCQPNLEEGNSCLRKCQKTVNVLVSFLTSGRGDPREMNRNLLSICNNTLCPRNIEAMANGTTVDLKRCSRCKIATYCSVECQTADWNHHKSSCVKLE